MAPMLRPSEGAVAENWSLHPGRRPGWEGAFDAMGERVPIPPSPKYAAVTYNYSPYPPTILKA